MTVLEAHVLVIGVSESGAQAEHACLHEHARVGRVTPLAVNQEVASVTAEDLVRPNHRIEAGLYLRRLNVDSFSQFFDFLGGASDVGSFKRSATEQGYYAQDTWSSERRGLSLTGGARLEHSSVTGETLVSPRGLLSGQSIRIGNCASVRVVITSFLTSNKCSGGWVIQF